MLKNILRILVWLGRTVLALLDGNNDSVNKTLDYANMSLENFKQAQRLKEIEDSNNRIEVQLLRQEVLELERNVSDVLRMHESFVEEYMKQHEQLNPTQEDTDQDTEEK